MVGNLEGSYLPGSAAPVRYEEGDGASGLKGLPIAGDACGKSLFPVKLGDGEVVALACSPGSLQCWKRLLSIVRTAQEILGEHGSGEIVAWSTTNPPVVRHPSSA